MMTIKNIDELIEAYRSDDISTKQMLKILGSQPTPIAIWVGDDDYNETKEDTLKGLYNYRKHLLSGNEVPLFFFPYLGESILDEFSFNNCLKGGK